MRETPMLEMETPPLMEARGLKKYFTTPLGVLHAVDDVSFRIAEAPWVWWESRGAASPPRGALCCVWWSPPGTMLLRARGSATI